MGWLRGQLPKALAELELAPPEGKDALRLHKLLYALRCFPVLLRFHKNRPDP